MIGRSMLAYVPVNLANVIVSFGTIVVLTRLLDSAEFGRYALAMITLQFVHMGLFTWLEAAIARFQARAEREGDENSYLKTIYMTALRLAGLGWLVMMGVLYLIPLGIALKTAIAVALTSTCFSLFLMLGMEFHKAAHRIYRYSVLYSTKLLLSFFIGIALIIFTPLKESAPFVGIIIGVSFVLFLDIPFILKKMQGGEVQTEKMKTYFAYGMPISFSLLLTYTLNAGDMFLITGYLGEAAAGKYNAGYNLANRSLDVLFIWISMAVTPIAITALEKEGLERSRVVLRDYGAALLWLSMPAATGIALVAESAGFIVGESVRAEAIQIMPFIAFSGVLNGLITYYAHRAFMLIGKTQMVVWAMIPPVIVNIGLNILLIPRMGLMGAVYATLVAYALGLIISMAVARRYYPLPIPVKAFVQIAFACVLMAGAVTLLPIPDDMPDYVELMLKGFVGAVVYGFVCFSTDTANCRDIMKNIFAKFSRRKSPDTSEAVEAV